MATREEIKDSVYNLIEDNCQSASGWIGNKAHTMELIMHYLDSEGIRLPDGERLIEVQEPIAEPEPEQSPKCTACEGKGFIEYEHGLIQVECEVCKGTGGIPAPDGGFILPPENIVLAENEPVIPLSEMAKGTVNDFEYTVSFEEPDDSSSGTGQLDSTPRGEHPSKPKQRKKRQAKRRTAKRSG